MTEPLINILIRTCGRKNLFARCMATINRQTYTNLRIIVGKDLRHEVDYSYIPENVECFGLYTENRDPYYYNEYCNQLKSEVREGWFLFLDDDDYFPHDRVLERLSEHLTEPNRPVIVQFERNSKPKPMNSFMERRLIISGHIGLPCLIMHADYRELGRIGTTTDEGDFEYIRQVAMKLRPKFVNMIVVATDRRSWGRIEDTKKEWV